MICFQKGSWLVGAGNAVEKEKGAVEREKKGDEDVVVEEADRARLGLRGGISDLERRGTSLVVDEATGHLGDEEGDGGEKTEDGADKELFGHEKDKGHVKGELAMADEEILR
jgi:hypothetical protein